MRKQAEDLKAISGTQPVRRQMLQTVLEFEQEFVRQRGDDPVLRREQADAQFDAAQIISEIGTNDGALDAYRRAARPLPGAARGRPAGRGPAALLRQQHQQRRLA